MKLDRSVFNTEYRSLSLLKFLVGYELSVTCPSNIQSEHFGDICRAISFASYGRLDHDLAHAKTSLPPCMFTIVPIKDFLASL